MFESIYGKILSVLPESVSKLATGHPAVIGAGLGVAGLSALYYGKQYFNGGQVSSQLLKSSDLRGKVVVVTGASPGGIGYETCKVLHRLGATVVLGVRSELLGKQSVELILKENKGLYKAEEDPKAADRLQVILIDLLDLASVKKFTTEFKQKFTSLDYLINNAGIMMCPHATTKQGIEIQIGTNHLGHFLLTLNLIDLVKKSNGRVVNLSSLAASQISNDKDVATFCTYTLDQVVGDGKNLAAPGKLYARSKLANALFTKQLEKELQKDSNAHAYSVHPGVVRTNLGRHLPKALMLLVGPIIFYFTKSALDGAQTSLYTTLAPTSDLKGGCYYSDCHEKSAGKYGDRADLQENLWQTSLELMKNYLD